LCWLYLAVAAFAGVAHADIFRPAYLELRQTGAERYDLLWKIPAQDPNIRLSLQIVLPHGTETITAPREVFSGDAVIERREILYPGGLAGQTIRIEGRAAGVTDVIARVERADGTVQVERLSAGTSQFTVRPPEGAGEIAWSYLLLGIEHILGGIDHLLFVMGLLLIVRGVRRIIATITAFTLAHSVTLIAATLGWIHVPGPPVEAIIALSIVYVAAEAVRRLDGAPDGLTARAPWIVAFGFGLLHGFGFAGALAEVGLPQKAVPVALLMFNIGVEIGQLVFVAALLLVMAGVRLVSTHNPPWLERAIPYGIGSVAMFWVIERIGSF